MKKVALLTCVGLMASPAFGGGVMSTAKEVACEYPVATALAVTGGATVAGYSVIKLLKQRRVTVAATEQGVPVVQQTAEDVIEEKQAMELATAAASDGVATDGAEG